jgi:sulfoxide reductase heme-binding subunit YedZ
MRQVLSHSKSYFALILLAFLAYLIPVLLSTFFHPAPLANVLGFLALIAYIITLIPSIFKTIFPATKSNKIIIWLLKNRRHIGIATFYFGSNHGLLLIIQKEINLLHPLTYIEYFQGISTLFIFSILAMTSNDWSVKKMKKNWQKIHQLTYLVVFLLPWHVLDKMSDQWSYLTPFAVFLSLINLLMFVVSKTMTKPIKI